MDVRGSAPLRPWGQNDIVMVTPGRCGDIARFKIADTIPVQWLSFWAFIFSLSTIWFWKQQAWLPESSQLDLPAPSRRVSQLESLINRERDIAKAYRQLNDRQLKLAFLSSEVQETSRLVDAYRTVVENRRRDVIREKSVQENWDKDMIASIIKELENKSSSFANDLLQSPLAGEPQQESHFPSPVKTNIKVESVVMINPNENARLKDSKSTGGKKLVDAQKNEYVLSNPRDATEKAVDTQLQIDLTSVILASAVGGVLCSFLKLPVIFGYIVAGALVGPWGFSVVDQVVQVQSLMQSGSTFLLFSLGVDFSWGKLRQSKRITIFSFVSLLCFTWLLVCIYSLGALDHLSAQVPANLHATKSMSIRMAELPSQIYQDREVGPAKRQAVNTKLDAVEESSKRGPSVIHMHEMIFIGFACGVSSTSYVLRSLQVVHDGSFVLTLKIELN